MILQLNPPLPVYCVGRGTGRAHLVIDYGPEEHLLWTVILDDGGAIWTLPNPLVRGQINASMGRTGLSSQGNSP